MPIYNTRDLVPFVNILEQRINELNESVVDWSVNKFKLISAASKVDSTHTTAISALVRADEAMAEIGTATFKSTANRGKRLEDTLNNLREEMFNIAASVEGGGGGGSLTSGMFYDELNNAIASVDATVEDGLKLDYRLREIQDAAQSGISASLKKLHIPYKYELANPETASLAVPIEEGIQFVNAQVTVLDEEGNPFLDQDGKIIVGEIEEDGGVLLTAIPPRPAFLFFPVRMSFQNIPEDFLYLLLQQMIQKNSRIMEVVMNFEDKIETIVSDIEYMKGVNWTPDFSIMRNHQELVKEGITPKGLDVEVKDGMAHVTFSYNDHPHLSHWICEKWDEEQQKFVPYDGVNGIISK